MNMKEKRAARAAKRAEKEQNGANGNNFASANISWFPGHMTKAKREITEYLKLVDFVIELRDARIPNSSKNPLIDVLVNQKPRIILLTKKDKADPIVTKKWIEELTNENTIVLAVDHFKDNITNLIVSNSKKLMQSKLDKMKAKGMNPRALRAMVLGIPNVGKSTMINRVVNKKIAEVSDRPGVTRHVKWIRLNKEVELLDTPGILWPKFEDQEIAYKLAIIGSINDNILNLEDVCYKLIDILVKYYPNELKARYDVSLENKNYEIFEAIARARGFVKKQNEIDYARATMVFLNEFRDNKIGNLSLEFVENE